MLYVPPSQSQTLEQNFANGKQKWEVMLIFYFHNITKINLSLLSPIAALEGCENKKGISLL